MAAVLATLALGGCGADEEPAQPSSTGATTGSSSTAARSDGQSAGESTDTGTTGTSGTSESTETGGAGGRSSSEDDEGGAGDEQPIGSEVRVEGRDGALTPRRIRVPPFIAVRLELRSRDGRRYRVSVAGRTLAAGPGDRARIILDGLMPDRSYALRGLDGVNDVRIVASGEPGG